MDNKPNWKDAPEWAKFLAMDEDGEWHWYQYKPIEPSLSDPSADSWGTKSGKWTSCKRWKSISSLEKRENNG